MVATTSLLALLAFVPSQVHALTCPLSTAPAGSVLIEQMLRTLNPSKIVLVILPKTGVPALKQVEKLLARPLYNTVRQQYGSTAEIMKRWGGSLRALVG